MPFAPSSSPQLPCIVMASIMSNLSITGLQEGAQQTFDYVIVGGGTAGLAVAARLSEDQDITVCVFEAGAARLNDPAIMTPAAFPSLVGGERYDWLLQTIPQVTGQQMMAEDILRAAIC